MSQLGTPVSICNGSFDFGTALIQTPKCSCTETNALTDRNEYFSPFDFSSAEIKIRV